MPKAAIRKWQEFYANLGISEDVAAEHLAYAAPLIQKQIPPIFEFYHLASLLGRTPFHLASLINATNKHYRIFSIPKRAGGRRYISAPYPSLLECQRWILVNILQKLSVHEAAHGFVRKRSIVSNAKEHVGQQDLLKLDITDFFPSISEPRVIALFRSLGYTKQVSFYLGRICCQNGVLPQGAATSPYISNIIAYRLDSRLAGLSKKLGIKYTRYADDLTFSGGEIVPSTIVSIRKVVESEGFFLNDGKVKLFCGRGKKVVTGIDVSGESPRVSRSFRRKISQEIYYCWRYGVQSHVSKKKVLHPFYIEQMKGKLAFWQAVEPESEQLSKLKDRLMDIENGKSPS